MASVYLIEDDPLISMANAQVLTRKGHQVHRFASGGAALLALHDYVPPDLAIVDLGLPDMDGIDVVRWIREQRSRTSLPIVVLSGSCGEVVIREALRAGANDYLVKPVSSSELAAKVGLSLSRKRAMSGASLTSQFLPGDIAFGRWRVTAYLGSGSYGTVYGVQSLDTEEPFALKVLATAERADQARFLRECYTLSACRQSSVPAVAAYGASEAGFYLVTEWVHGIDLRTYLEVHGVLSEQETLEFLEGIARAFVVLERAGVVHRDIKPANVLLRMGRPSDPVLVDFGLAKYTSLGRGLTTEEVVMGTPGFIAPEVASGEEPGFASDMFALGVLARALLTGELPYPKLRGAVLIERMRAEGVDMNIGVSAELEELLADMTHPSPKDRVSAFQLTRRLESLLDRSRTWGSRSERFVASSCLSPWSRLSTHHP